MLFINITNFTLVIFFKRAYKTLHSYKLFWAVCHLFPQRWRTLTYSVSGNHWPGEPRDMFKTTSARKFKSCIFEPPTRRVFSINTSSSNTLVLFDQISPQQLPHKLKVISLHIVKLFQVLIPIMIQFDINKQFYSTHRWNPNRYCHIGFQSGPGSNVSELVLHSPQSFWTEPWPSQ